jgi:hypothetical protein
MFYLLPLYTHVKVAQTSYSVRGVEGPPLAEILSCVGLIIRFHWPLFVDRIWIEVKWKWNKLTDIIPFQEGTQIELSIQIQIPLLPCEYTRYSTVQRLVTFYSAPRSQRHFPASHPIPSSHPHSFRRICEQKKVCAQTNFLLILIISFQQPSDSTIAVSSTVLVSIVFPITQALDFLPKRSGAHRNNSYKIHPYKHHTSLVLCCPYCTHPDRAHNYFSTSDHAPYRIGANYHL